MKEGREFLIDSGADTCAAGKHAWITEVIEGVTVSAKGFSDNLPIEEDLPNVNAIYAYDSTYTGEVILLEINHYIYMGDKKVDSIACQNQIRLNGIYVNNLPCQIFPDIDKAQTIIADELRIPLHFHGPLAYLNIRQPTATEISNYDLQRIALTSPRGRDPYGVDSLSLNKQSKPFQVCKVSSFLSYAPWSLFVFNTTKNRSINPEDIIAR